MVAARGGSRFLDWSAVPAERRCLCGGSQSWRRSCSHWPSCTASQPIRYKRRFKRSPVRCEAVGLTSWCSRAFRTPPLPRATVDGVHPRRPNRGLRFETPRASDRSVLRPDTAPRGLALPPTPSSEDCLTLNVWTPAKSSGERLPVMVWIHGGGFTAGRVSVAPHRWDEPGSSWRRRGELRVPIGSAGVSGAPSALARIGTSSLRQLRTARSDRRAPLGSREHRGVRRQSGERDAVRIVSRRVQPGIPHGLAARTRIVPSRHCAEPWVRRLPGRSRDFAFPTMASRRPKPQGESIAQDIATLRALSADEVLARAAERSETRECATSRSSTVTSCRTIPPFSWARTAS